MSTAAAPSGTEEAAGGLLGQRRFVRIWAGQAAGAVGDQLLPVAMNLYALRAGGGVSAVGWILGGRAVALVLCLALGGLAADRLRRTRLLVSADVLRAVLLAATAVVLPYLALGQLPVVTALVGGAEALSRPAYRSLIPQLLPERLLERGNAAAAGAQRSSAVLGALAGTAAVAALGARWTLAAAAAVYAMGALTVVGVREDKRPRDRADASSPSLPAQVAAGWQAVRQRPWAAAVMATTGLHLFAGSATALTLLPVVARQRLGGNLAYGLAIAAMAAGALPALVLAGRRRPARPGTVAVGGLTAFAAVPLEPGGRRRRYRSSWAAGPWADSPSRRTWSTGCPPCNARYRSGSRAGSWPWTSSRPSPPAPGVCPRRAGRVRGRPARGAAVRPLRRRREHAAVPGRARRQHPERPRPGPG